MKRPDREGMEDAGDLVADPSAQLGYRLAAPRSTHGLILSRSSLLSNIDTGKHLRRLSNAPHSVLTTMYSPASGPPSSSSCMAFSPSLVIVLVLSMYAPFVPVPKMAPMSAGPCWYERERRVPTVCG